MGCRVCKICRICRRYSCVDLLVLFRVTVILFHSIHRWLEIKVNMCDMWSIVNLPVIPRVTNRSSIVAKEAKKTVGNHKTISSG